MCTLLVACSVGSANSPRSGTTSTRPAARGNEPTAGRVLRFKPPRMNGAVWFADELWPVAEAVADVFAQPGYGGWRVVPPAKLRALFADVRAGRLAGIEACALPPPPGELAAHLYREAATGTMVISCEAKACELTVSIYEAPAKVPEGKRADRLAYYAVALPFGASPSDWARHIREAKLVATPPPPPPQISGGLLVGPSVGKGPGIYVNVRDVVQSADWKAPIDAQRLQPHAASFRACSKPDAIERDWWTQPTLIEVDATGHVTRCEPEHVDRLAPPRVACQCDVLRSIDFGRGAAGRRAGFYLWTTRIGVSAARDNLYRNAHLQDTTADDPTALLGTHDLPNAVEGCLADVKQPVEVDVPVSFEVLAQGRVQAVDARWPASLPTAVTECIDAALAKARFTCPLSGHATVEANLSITVQPYKKGALPL